jgi:hypothetical protein
VCFGGIFGPGSKLLQQYEFHYFVKIPALKSSMNIILSTFGFPFVLDTCEQGNMPRKYKRPLRTQHYANYCEIHLKRCLEDISTGVQSAQRMLKQLLVLPLHHEVKHPLENKEDRRKSLCHHQIQVLVLMTLVSMMTVPRMMEVILKTQCQKIK